ncbi:polysaccharide pyruvyl transferase family protein [bacterium]|nr:polysaccharide pyruvyl transferase family protein [bacterium]
MGRVTGEEPLVVCDPTLLVSLEDLESSAGEDEEYLLTYILGTPDPQILRDSIAELRKKTGVYKVKAIVGPALQNWRSPREADDVLWGPRPADWLGLIKNCKVLLTDSFHGCLFAMKYDVPFVGFYKEALRAPRLVDLNERYSLGDQICDEADLVEVCCGGCSTLSGESRMKVIKHIEQSEDYLKGALAPNLK